MVKKEELVSKAHKAPANSGDQLAASKSAANASPELVRQMPADLSVEEEKKEQKHPKPKHAEKKDSLGKGPFSWVEYKPKEIEEVIVNLANSGHAPSHVGMVLRDQYGIPNVKQVLGKKVEEVFADHNLMHEVPFELLDLIKKSVQIENHLKQNKKDMTAKRGFQLTVSKIRRLVKHYHKIGKLPRDWKYTSERAALLIK